MKAPRTLHQFDDENWEEFNRGFPDEGECPPSKPLTPAEVEFWFEELDEDGKPIPLPKWKVN